LSAIDYPVSGDCPQFLGHPFLRNSKNSPFHLKGVQGVKIGTGGHLPGDKVQGKIAEVRGLEPGQAAISPSAFTDLQSVADFRNPADEVRELSGGIPIGFKLSANRIEDDIDFAMACSADYIILDGRGRGRGRGTGAAPLIFRNNISVSTNPALARACKHLEPKTGGEVSLVITGGLRVAEDFVNFLEKNTRKNNRNFSLSSSQTGEDESAKRTPGAKSKGSGGQGQPFDKSRTIESIQTIPVSSCSCCGEDLSGIDASEHERRTRIDMVFEKTVEHFDAEIKTCPSCQASTKGEFDADLLVPQQYGVGVKAYVLNLLVTQMIKFNRAGKLVHALLGQLVIESAFLRWIMALRNKLQSGRSRRSRRCWRAPCSTSTRSR